MRYSAAGTLTIVYRPPSPVRVPSPVPTSRICAPTSGCSDSLTTRPLIVPVCACAVTAALRRTTHCNERIRMRNSWVGGVRNDVLKRLFNATSPASMHVTSAGVKLVHVNLRCCPLYSGHCVGEGDGYRKRAGRRVGVMKRDAGRASTRRGELIAARVRIIDLKSDEVSALPRDEERDRVATSGNAFVWGNRHSQWQRIQRVGAGRASDDCDECQERSSHVYRPGQRTVGV